MLEFEYIAKARIELLDIVRYTVDTWRQSQATKYVDGLETLAQQLAETPTLVKRGMTFQASAGCYVSPMKSTYFITPKLPREYLYCGFA